MESPRNLALPTDAKCIDCGYALFGNISWRCPECGREFDPSVRSTYHLGNVEAAARAARHMHNSRIGTVISLVLVFLAGHSELPTLAIALCLPTIVGVVMTLYFQTQAALLALGRKEANRYLISALILMPIWLVGPLLVPTLVGIEVQNWVRSESRS